MKRTVTIACAWCGEHDMDVFDAAPGLIVHREFPCGTLDELWCVTHERSSHCVTEADNPEAAMSLAATLAKECDWTVSGDALRDRWGRFGHELYKIVPRPRGSVDSDPERLSA